MRSSRERGCTPVEVRDRTTFGGALVLDRKFQTHRALVALTKSHLCAIESADVAVGLPGLRQSLRGYYGYRYEWSTGCDAARAP